MRKHLLLLIGIVAGLAVGAGGAVAATGGSDKPAESAGASTEAIGGASAPGARLAAIINGNAFTAGPPADFVVQRSVGVQSVTNPEAGTFCIKPLASAIPSNQMGRVVPSVSAMFVGSGEYQAFAQYVIPRSALCPAGTLSFYTFSQNNGGDPVDSSDNNIQFSVVID